MLYYGTHHTHMFCANPRGELYTPEPTQGHQDVSSGAVIPDDFEEPLRLLTGHHKWSPIFTQAR